jgi:hypothetical protein
MSVTARPKDPIKRDTSSVTIAPRAALGALLLVAFSGCSMTRPDREPARTAVSLTPLTQQSTQLTRDPTQLTPEEMESVKRQIAECWNPPVVAPPNKESRLLAVLKLWLNRDGSVRSIELAEGGSPKDASSYAVAESAKRAILRCSPLRLPPEKYEDWQTMTLTFDPWVR